MGLTGAGIPSGNNTLYSGLASIDETNTNLTWVVPTTTFFNNNVIPPPALDSERYRGNVAEVKQNGSILDLPITNPKSNGKVYIAHRTTTVNGATTVVPDDTSFTDVNGNQFIGSYVGTAINDTDPTQPDFGPGDHSNDFGRLQPDGLGTTSAERTLISHIWANDGGSYGPNYSWEDIGRQLAIANKSSLADTALVFGELAQGLSDVFENAWNIKWDRDYFWRPVSGIRGADQIPVGTDSTNQDKIGTSDLVDANWTPREETPQHPCHPSGSSTTGGDASTILANFYGDSSAAFTVSAAPHPNSSRLREALVSLNGNDLVPVKTATGTVMEHVDSLSKTYTSLREAANDIRTSRIYSGAHYRFATEAGVNLGEQSGSYYVRHNPFVTGVTK